jgi:molecular chaperone GrpE
MFLTRFAVKRTPAFKQAYTAMVSQTTVNPIANTTSGVTTRYFASKAKKEEVKAVTEEKEAVKEEEKTEEPVEEKKEETSSDESDEEITLKAKEIKKLLKEQDDEIEVLRKKLENAKKQYQYQLAENDNTVKRYKAEVKKAKDYSISKFAIELLEVRDNLRLAIDHAQKVKIEDIEELKE